MKKMQLFEVLKSRYCLFVFGLMIIVSYFLVPKKIFYGYYNILAVVFIIVFSLTITCLVRSIKDRFVEQRKHKTKSIISIIFGVIGLSALHTCTVGVPMCGASVGLAFISAIFPTVAFDFMSKYALLIVIISIIIQGVSLYRMKCFR